MEDERDKLFDHDFDGIREYDNPMPRWWVWLFAATIAFAFPYVLHYHFGQGPSIQQSLALEIEAYANQLLATYGDLEPDVPTIVDYMDDETAMTGMAGLFRGKCAQCHQADGTGNVGPNLTDQHWINVKQVTDIAEVIRNGVTAKGMPAWGEKLTETEIVLLSSYVARMRLNPQPGKEEQGEPIDPWPTADMVHPVEEDPDPAEGVES